MESGLSMREQKEGSAVEIRSRGCRGPGGIARAQRCCRRVHLLALPAHHASKATAETAVIGCALHRTQRSAAARAMHSQMSLLSSSTGGEASSIARASGVCY